MCQLERINLMKHLKKSLKKGGLSPPIAIPSELPFQSHPQGSLTEILNSIDKKPSAPLNRLRYQKIYERKLHSAQGITWAYDNICFISSGDCIFKYSFPENPYNAKESEIVRLDVWQLRYYLSLIGIENKGYNHFGDPVYYNGILFITVEEPNYNYSPLLLALNNNLQLLGWSFLIANGDGHSPGCAINPWDKRLYTWGDSNESCMHVYNVDEYYKRNLTYDNVGKEIIFSPATDINEYHLYMENIKTPNITRTIQGAVFSTSGKLYLSVSVKRTTCWDNYIYAINTLTGKRISKSYHDYVGAYDEIEGLTIHPSGCFLITICDNDYWPGDEGDIMIYAVTYPGYPNNPWWNI